MITAEPSDLLVRAAALYIPITLTTAFAIWRRPNRARIAAASLATVWNLVFLLALNVAAPRVGWWTFHADVGTVSGVPVDLWVGWALLWGAVPVLARLDNVVVAAGVLVVADLVLMPLAAPVVVLHPGWLLGETVAVAMCLVPGLLLARWTARREQLPARASLQLVEFAGLLFFVVPTLVFTATGEGWGPLLARPRWHFVLAAVLLAPAVGLAVQAVREFMLHGGTPFPLDPPTRLVTTGPYAYVANPMQLGACVLLVGWGALLKSPLVMIAGCPVGVMFSAGFAAWSENGELSLRFGDVWDEYRRDVRAWLPRWRPTIRQRATVFVARSCEPCDQVGDFLTARHPLGLDVLPAEMCHRDLRRITYEGPSGSATGIAAIGRSLEHVDLAWATASWVARLPGVQQVLQLVTDAVGGGPRGLERHQRRPDASST